MIFAMFDYAKITVKDNAIILQYATMIMQNSCKDLLRRRRNELVSFGGKDLEQVNEYFLLRS